MNELAAHHTFVGEDAENELFMVVFAEEEGEQGERLGIQRAFAFDDQDRSLGQDTYCLVSREGVSYGGVTSWSLTGKVLTLALDETCSEALAADGGYEILIEADGDKLEAIRAGLKRALEGPP
jgi:hypothetical protein